MQIVIPPDFHDHISGYSLLLDTSVLIDALVYGENFSSFLLQLKNQKIQLITIDPVVIEFTQNTDHPDKLKKKMVVIEEIVDIFFSVESVLFDEAKKLVIRYGCDNKGVSITDFLLGSVLIKNPENLLLVTKNTTDFPTNIFTIKTHFLLYHRKGIHCYGVYSYDPHH